MKAEEAKRLTENWRKEAAHEEYLDVIDDIKMASEKGKGAIQLADLSPYTKNKLIEDGYTLTSEVGPATSLKLTHYWTRIIKISWL